MKGCLSVLLLGVRAQCFVVDRSAQAYLNDIGVEMDVCRGPRNLATWGGELRWMKEILHDFGLPYLIRRVWARWTPRAVGGRLHRGSKFTVRIVQVQYKSRCVAVW